MKNGKEGERETERGGKEREGERQRGKEGGNRMEGSGGEESGGEEGGKEGDQHPLEGVDWKGSERRRTKGGKLGVRGATRVSVRPKLS